MGILDWFGPSAWEKKTSTQLTDLLMEVKNLMGLIDDLKAKITTLITDVTAEGDAVKAAVIAINGLTATQAELIQQLKDAQALGDPVAIQEAIDALDAQNKAVEAQTAELAAAIPAQPEP